MAERFEDKRQNTLRKQAHGKRSGGKANWPVHQANVFIEGRSTSALGSQTLRDKQVSYKALQQAYFWLLQGSLLSRFEAVQYAQNLFHQVSRVDHIGTQVEAKAGLIWCNWYLGELSAEEGHTQLIALQPNFKQQLPACLLQHQAFYTAHLNEPEATTLLWQQGLAEQEQPTYLPLLLVLHAKKADSLTLNIAKPQWLSTLHLALKTSVNAAGLSALTHGIHEPLLHGLHTLFQQAEGLPGLQQLGMQALSKLAPFYPYTGWAVEAQVKHAELLQQPKQAIEVLQEGIQMCPYQPKLQVRLGKFHLKRGNVPEALNSLEQLLEVSPTLHDRRLELGQLYLGEKAYFKALYHAKFLLETTDKHAKAYWLSAQSLAGIQDFEGAIDHGHKALEYGPGNKWLVPVAQQLANWYYHHKQDYQSAVALLKFALQLSDNSPEVMARLAEIHSEQGEYRAAIALYRELLQHYPDNPELFTYLGYLLWQMHYSDEAKVAYEHALRLKPDNAIAHNNLGVILLDSLFSPSEAMHHFKTALEQKPNYAMAAFNLGRSLSVLGKKDEAREAYCQAMTINKTTKELAEADIEERIMAAFEV